MTPHIHFSFYTVPDFEKTTKKKADSRIEGEVSLIVSMRSLRLQ